MKQKYLFKLLIFILMLAAHMYFYDPSFLKFIKNVQYASELQFNDQFLLNAVIWVIGFWGIIIFLNSKNKTYRFSCWVLFVVTAFIEFAYVKVLNQSFMLDNVQQLFHVLSSVSTIAIVPLLQFLALTSLVIIIAFSLKPLDISITNTFVVMLFAALFLLLVSNKGLNMVVPTFYLIPLLIMYKYVIIIYEAMKSGSTIPLKKT